MSNNRSIAVRGNGLYIFVLENARTVFIVVSQWCSRSFLVQVFFRFAGVSYGRSVNVCSGTIGDR